jgi:serine/threonine protein kinase
MRYSETGLDASIHGDAVEVDSQGYVLSELSKKDPDRPIHGSIHVTATEQRPISMAHKLMSTRMLNLPSGDLPKAAGTVSYFDLMPRLKEIPINLTMDDFTDVRHFADGTNASVFLVKWKGELCIVKMIKEEKDGDPVASHEFDVEHGLLERVTHPNIVNILGAGEAPRRFLLLEYLSGGTMKGLMDSKARKKAFSFKEALVRGRELALALQHLHSSLGNGVVLVHRDLKPDNVAFNAAGTLVLFDMGLSTLVRRSDVADQTYEMTGQTGSLRYMAPEVMMSKPYNEKVDVYSFAIILWQMASGELPYDGASKADFVKFVGKRGERPELAPYMSWPKDFKDLLVSCWAQSSKERPAFDVVITRLDKLILKTGDSSGECGCVTV